MNARGKQAKRVLKTLSPLFTLTDLSTKNNVPDWMTRCFQNNRFLVMIDDNAKTTHGKAIRAMVQKHDDTPIINHWHAMQQIKNEIFGSETMAIEYYPAESCLVDLHNIYWMWIFPLDVLPLPINPQ